MDLHNRWSHRWHHHKIKPYNSPIHGLGVVAVKDIAKGEIIFVYGGIIVPTDQVTNYWKEMGHVGIQIDDGFFMVPSSRQELERDGVINHSCEPNVGFKDQIQLVALRDIRPGDEITFDYAMCESFMESFDCKCGNKTCRKVIAQDDWQRKEVQDKYGQYFSPYLKLKLIKS